MSWSHLFTDPRALQIYQEWKSAILNTNPVDEHEVRRGVSDVYRVLVGRDPKLVLIFDSPQQAILALGAQSHANTKSMFLGPLDSIGRHLTGQPVGGLHTALSSVVRTCLIEPISLAVRHPSASRNMSGAITGARKSLRRQMHCREHRAAIATLNMTPETILDTGQCIGSLAQQSYLREACPGQFATMDQALSEALDKLCRAAAWMWLFEDYAVLSDRPEFVAVDLETGLAAFEGLALRFRDGFEVRLTSGPRVPAWLVDAPHLITPKHIEREPNTEIRRVLLEHMGIGRYISESGALKVKADSTGILWRREFIRQAGGHSARMPLCFVEVVNGTPEPDGSYRHYFLRVPPWMRTPRQAVAWTYGLEERAYRPRIRT